MNKRNFIISGILIIIISIIVGVFFGLRNTSHKTQPNPKPENTDQNITDEERYERARASAFLKSAEEQDTNFCDTDSGDNCDK